MKGCDAIGPEYNCFISMTKFQSNPSVDLSLYIRSLDLSEASGAKGSRHETCHLDYSRLELGDKELKVSPSTYQTTATNSLSLSLKK